MRAHLTASVFLAALAVSACGDGREAEAPMPSADSATTPAGAPAPAPALANVPLTLGCGAPFTRDATPATLAAVFGRENVIPEEISGPEGMPLNVTAIYPNDPARRIEVIFSDEEARTGLATVMVSNPESLWTGPGGLKIGASMTSVEDANGGPFNVMGFEWDYGGYVSDWQGGKLGEANGCSTTVRLTTSEGALPDEIVGDGVTPASDLPAMRAAQPKVTSFGINWTPLT